MKPKQHLEFSRHVHERCRELSGEVASLLLSDLVEEQLKIIFATDLRRPAVSTQALLTGLDWPAGAWIEVLHVLPPLRSAFFGPARAPGEEAVALARRETGALAATLGEQLRAKEVGVHGTVLVGDAAHEIARRAEEIHADLVVIGGPRGGNPAHLRSVAIALLDHTPCALLIARKDNARRVLLADDGSPSADVAAEMVARWPMLASLPVTVVSVADVSAPVLAGPHAQIPHALERTESTRTLAWELVERRVAQLRSSGRHVLGLVREGDAATELLQVSDSLRVDLLVLGSSSKFGLTRLLLGSVARSVVLSSDSSVLIARAG